MRLHISNATNCEGMLAGEGKEIPRAVWLTSTYPNATLETVSRAGLCPLDTPITVKSLPEVRRIIAESKFDDILDSDVTKKELKSIRHVDTPGILRRKFERKAHFKRMDRKKNLRKCMMIKNRREPREWKEPNEATIDREYRKLMERGIDAEALFDNILSAPSADLTFLEFISSVFSPLIEEFSSVSDVLLPSIEFIYQLWRSRNILDALVACNMFVRAMRLDLTQIVRDLINTFRVAVMATRAWMFPHAEALSDKLSDYKVFFGQIITSGFATAIRDLVLSFVSLKMFDNDVSKQISKLVGHLPKMTVAELISFIFDQFLAILRVGEALVRGDPFHTVLLAKNPAKEFMDAVKQLTFYEDKLYTGLPVSGMMGQRDYVMETASLVEVGEKLLSTMNSFSAPFTGVRDALLRVKQSHFDVVQVMNASSRAVPFGLILHGDPAIGKGRLLPFIANVWASVKGREFDDSHIFHRVATSDYWEGYQPFSQYVVHYSELGNLHADIAKSKGDPRVAELTSLIDSLPMLIDMAFDKKGKMYAQPEIVMVDTNSPDLNLNVLVKNKAAYQRRFLFVHPIVKPEFRYDVGTGLDPEKSFASDTKIMDRWLFNVYIFRSEDSVNAKAVTLMSGTAEDDIFKLVKVLRQLFTSHIRNQENISSLANVFDLCDYDKEHRDLFFAEDHISEEEHKGDVDTFAEYYTDSTAVVNRLNNTRVRFDPLFPKAEALFDSHEDIFREIQSFDPDQYIDFEERKAEVSERGKATGYLPKIFRNTVEVAKAKKYTIWEDLSSRFDIYNKRRVNYGKTFTEKAKLWFPLFFTSLWQFLYQGSLATMMILTPNPSTIWVPRYFVCMGLSIIWMYCSMGIFSVITACYSTLFVIAKSGPINVYLVKTARNVYLARATKAYKRLLHILGYNPDYVESDSSWWIHNCSTFLLVVVGVSAALGVYRKFKSGKTFSYQPSKVERGIAEYLVAENDIIPMKAKPTAIEEKLECCDSVKRVAVKGHAMWNPLVELPSGAVHSESSERLAQSFVRNTRLAQVDGSRSGRTHVFGICGSYALINTHALGYDEKVTIRVANTGLSVGDSLVFYDSIITERDRVDLGNDLTLVSLKSTQFRDIRKHISTTYTANRLCNGFVSPCAVRIESLPEGNYVMHSEFGDIPMTRMYKYTRPEHKVGDCGLPMFMDVSGGSMFVGIHCGGLAEHGYATVVLRDFIDNAIEQLKTKSPYISVASEGVIMAEFNMEEPVSKSPFRYEILHGVTYYGKIPGFVNIRAKSKLKLTKVGEIFREYMFENFGYIPSVEVCPPLMMPKTIMRDGEKVYLSPYNIALKKISAQRGTLDSDIMSKCIDVFSKHIIKGLEALGVTQLQPLSFEAAINGSPEDPFLKRINTSTAAGFGLSGKKKDHLPLVDEEGVAREMAEELRLEVDFIFDAYEEEKSGGFVFDVHLKDEARDKRKVLEGKTRPFYATPLAGLIVSRMLLSPVYTLMVQYSDVFCTAVGINMPSHGGKLYNSLVEFSECIMEGDYGNFDQSMPFDIGLAAYTVVYNICKHFGYSEHALRALRCVATDLLFVFIQMCLDLFCAPGLQPSGMYGTAENNSLRGVLMLMYYWYSNDATRLFDFFEHVLPKTYGDDLLAAVKSAFKDVFNNVTYAKFCKDVYKIPYTSASKTGVLKPFVKKEECSFLKRTFKYREDIEQWVCPISMDSILKSLEWRIPSTSVTSEEQMKSTLNSALWELAYHMTERQHDCVRQLLVNCIADEFCLGERFETPTWAEIIQRTFDQ